AGRDRARAVVAGRAGVRARCGDRARRAGLALADRPAAAAAQPGLQGLHPAADSLPAGRAGGRPGLAGAAHAPARMAGRRAVPGQRRGLCVALVAPGPGGAALTARRASVTLAFEAMPPGKPPSPPPTTSRDE